jgi:hypothetical protein
MKETKECQYELVTNINDWYHHRNHDRIFNR